MITFIGIKEREIGLVHQYGVWAAFAYLPHFVDGVQFLEQPRVPLGATELVDAQLKESIVDLIALIGENGSPFSL